MCGQSMPLEGREQADRIPGTTQTVVRVVQEWVCPECDYFEEKEQRGAGDAPAQPQE